MPRRMGCGLSHGIIFSNDGVSIYVQGSTREQRIVNIEVGPGDHNIFVHEVKPLSENRSFKNSQVLLSPSVASSFVISLNKASHSVFQQL